jgi:uncharacterized damage-inducible protein DinB
MSVALFRTLGDFNAWVNERLYDSCAQLSKDDYTRERKAFFGSIHRTLNHILVVDQLWRGRIEGWTPTIRSLADIPHENFNGLRAAREAEDGALKTLVGGLDEKRLERAVRYVFLDGTPAEAPLDLLLITLFNHQTHHRGQVHVMLTQSSITPPPLDILDFHMDPARREP